MGKICILDFDGVYQQEDFYKSYEYQWIDFTDLKGVNGYCEHHSLLEIQKAILPYAGKHLSFLGNGNYHYIAYLYLAMIKEPFSLLHFDHHTDTQTSLFSELISCGSWLEKALLQLPNLKHVVSVGVRNDQKKDIQPSYQEKIRCISEKEAVSLTWDSIEPLLKEEDVYISLDKDVIRREETITNWDQGILSKKKILTFMESCLQRKNVIGIDVCGEYAEDMGGSMIEQDHAYFINNGMNEEVIELCERMGYFS